MRLVIFLSGPLELKRLDGLDIVIRDDHPWRGQGTPVAGGPTPEQVAKQIWGLYRFVPGTGPGADPVRGIPGADPTGRTAPTGGLPVGEELPFTMELNRPPSWSGWDLDGWRRAVGPLLRLRLECHRDGWAPWILPCEMQIVSGTGSTEIPRQT